MSADNEQRPDFAEALDDLLNTYFEYKFTDYKWDHCGYGKIEQFYKNYWDLREKFLTLYSPPTP